MWVIELNRKSGISYLTKYGPGSIMLALVFKSEEHCRRMPLRFNSFRYGSGQFLELEPDMECYSYLKSKGNNDRNRYCQSMS